MHDPYQPPAATPALAPAGRRGLVVGVLLSILTAALVTVAVSHFRDVLSAFGADLPALSRVVLHGYCIAWLVPPGILALWLVLDPDGRDGVAFRIGWLSLLVLLPLCMVGLYLPLFKLAAVV
jgi:hypothetical protein